MSPFLFSADLAVTDLGHRARATATVGDVRDSYAASLIGEYLSARSAGRADVMALIRDHAEVIDPGLLDELDGAVDYPAAA